MRIVYVLLSPTFGMHQYTADLANRMATAGSSEVHLVTTPRAPRDRYSPLVHIHAPVAVTDTGLSPRALNLSHLRRVIKSILSLKPSLVHFSGPHLWNLTLVRYLVRQGIPVIHTIHDLDPHRGTRFGLLLRLWNWTIIHSADQILLHGDQYRLRLLRRGVPAPKLSFTPLLHLFLGYEQAMKLSELERGEKTGYEPFVLFFGRLERYKGIDYLLTAFAQLTQQATAAGAPPFKLVLAGPGKFPALWPGSLPPGVELRNRLIADQEAVDLFSRCSLVVLPYTDATQSALIPAAYFFRKPVLVTRVGALTEYVQEERTGFVVEPGHPPSMARALAHALADPSRLQAMGVAGRAWYDKTRVQETLALLSLYERLANRQLLPAAAASRQLTVPS